MYVKFATTPYQPLLWQLSLISVVWLCVAINAGAFIKRLPVGELEFDGAVWFFAEKIGSINIQFDGQTSMLLRFEEELGQTSWLWLESRSDASADQIVWQDLRRAVYSQPVNLQYLAIS